MAWPHPRVILQPKFWLQFGNIQRHDWEFLRLEHYTNGLSHYTLSLNLMLELRYQQKIQLSITLHIPARMWDTSVHKAHQSPAVLCNSRQLYSKPLICAPLIWAGSEAWKKPAFPQTEYYLRTLNTIMSHSLCFAWCYLHLLPTVSTERSIVILKKCLLLSCLSHLPHHTFALCRRCSKSAAKDSRDMPSPCSVVGFCCRITALIKSHVYITTTISPRVKYFSSRNSL